MFVLSILNLSSHHCRDILLLLSPYFSVSSYIVVIIYPCHSRPMFLFRDVPSPFIIYHHTHRDAVLVWFTFRLHFTCPPRHTRFLVPFPIVLTLSVLLVSLTQSPLAQPPGALHHLKPASVGPSSFQIRVVPVRRG